MELDTRYLPSITELTADVISRILELNAQSPSAEFEVEVKDVLAERVELTPKRVGSYSIKFRGPSGKQMSIYTIYAARLAKGIDLSEIEYFDEEKDNLTSFVNGELEDLKAKKIIVELTEKLKALNSEEPRASAAAQ